MKAATIHQYGANHELHVEEMPKPIVDRIDNPHQVLIRVYAAGINPMDTKARDGSMKLVLSGKFPKVLGGECAGIVEAVGLMVKNLQPGDRVVASLGPEGGGYAEYAVAKDTQVVKLPDAVSFVQAAALPIAAGTALQALLDKGEVRPDDRVLINGATGGVGTFAIQIAKILGAHVTAVCSTEGAALARQLGADQVIDYNAHDFTKGIEKYDLVFDAIGKSSFDDCQNVLKEDGMYITTLPSAKQVLNQAITTFTSKKAESLLFTFKPEQINWLLKQVTDGKLVPVIERTYRLDELAQAHAESETGHVKGKLVVEVESEPKSEKS
ncbi:NADPH:quinone reductase-like Zn-dependent oxidoreductase [Larkinella arboricola]|uniref:NADPH:quinone reductase-like Zn-dependent oxidoreductase n=1 Tax=Larkinella arboricola TaxID=643671 RepID=A0A327X352_LARAB|nr:NAD(P)-dependent alcohol dehydrogenase [Larkinella arboricola]RAK00099.1 NADPH:quinone reductase-like Zn-dependent oxidoreductase [Larkinella arboricola]